MTAVRLVDITAELLGAIFCMMAALSSLKDVKIDNHTQKFVYLEINNVLLLLADIVAIFYRGTPGAVGYYAVRISNFAVFLLSYIMIITVSRFLFCYTDSEKAFQKFWQIGMYVVTGVEILMLVVSQFNNMFYYFDEGNYYHRGDFFIYSQLFAVIGPVAMLILLIQNRKKMRRSQFLGFLSYVLLPGIAIVVQIFTYGLALFNMAITASVILLFFMYQSEKSRKMVEQERALNEMKLKVVLSQLQPHYLYNSLTSIYYLCAQDAGAAQQAIKEFSSYLRGNLDSLRTNSPVPLEEELNHVDNYLKLEKLRFKDRLNVVYDIQTKDFSLPTLTLQPIVENAVKHGIAGRSDGGTITITAQEMPKEFLLSVSDDGEGFDINEKKEDGRSHTGIFNVNERLMNMCGGRVIIKSEVGKGTVATIHIPKES